MFISKHYLKKKKQNIDFKNIFFQYKFGKYKK